MRYDFLVETYRTERLKTLTAWSEVSDDRMDVRLEPRARTAREHMVHQCLSEHGWMTTMLGITVPGTPLPANETRLAFIDHYAAVSDARLAELAAKPEAWFEEGVAFFDVPRSRAWVLTRRFTHSAHHRGQLLAYLRLWGEPLYSNYGPTADTGGLAADGGRVIYRYESVEALLEGEKRGGAHPFLPGAGPRVTERG